MTMLEIVTEPQLVTWADHVIEGGNFRDDAVAIGLVDGEEVKGVIVYEGFTASNCNMHVASDLSGHWITRELLFTAFAYPFIQCGLRRVTGLVPSKNTRALDFDLKLGFTPEGKMRHFLPDGDDMIILGMLREDCPFISKEARHGRR